MRHPLLALTAVLLSAQLSVGQPVAPISRFPPSQARFCTKVSDDGSTYPYQYSCPSGQNCVLDQSRGAYYCDLGATGSYGQSPGTGACKFGLSLSPFTAICGGIGAACYDDVNNGVASDSLCASGYCDKTLGLCANRVSTIGASCTSQDQCASSLFCRSDGTCQKKGAIGSSCESTYSCLDSLYCSTLAASPGYQNKCLLQGVLVGRPCANDNKYGCGGGLFCYAGPYGPKCALSSSVVGDSCMNDLSGTACSGPNLYCRTSDTTCQIRQNSIGADCRGDPISACGSTRASDGSIVPLYCSLPSYTCAAKGGAGASCVSNPTAACLDGLYCSSNLNVCTAQVYKEGVSCDADPYGQCGLDPSLASPGYNGQLYPLVQVGPDGDQFCICSRSRGSVSQTPPLGTFGLTSIGADCSSESTFACGFSPSGIKLYCALSTNTCQAHVTTVGGSCAYDYLGACGVTTDGTLTQLFPSIPVGSSGHADCTCVTQADVAVRPSSRARARARIRRNLSLCPGSHTACPIGNGFECIDTENNIEQCGGCSGGGGVDCTALLGVSAVGSASEPLSPQSAAASLSWSPLPNIGVGEADVGDTSEAEGEGDLTPALVRISLVAGLGGLLFGFDTGVTSSALLAIGTALGGSELSLSQQTGIVVSALWGALAGSLVASRAADVFGRKPVIIAAAVLFLLGALEQAAAQVYKEVILGRVLVGIGVGLSSMTLPIYLAEIAPSKFRGRVVASLVVLITGGQVLAYITGAAFFHVTKGWRWMFGLGAVPAGVQLLLSFSLPESPRYHVRKGRLVTATKTIQRLNPSFTNEAVQRRLLSLQKEVRTQDPVGDRAGDPRRLLSSAIQKTQSWRLSELREGKVGRMWEDRANRRALLVACGLQFFQQATGFNTLMYYAAKIIHQTGLGQPAAFAIFVAVSNFLSTIVALRLIDRVGRRALLLRTLLGMIGGMALLSFAFIFIHLTPEKEAAAMVVQAASPWAFVAVFAMCVFCVSYALGLGNVAWVVQSEVFNQELRALGNGLATAVNWSANLIVSSTFLHLSHAATPAGAFGLYAIVACLAWLFTYFYLPETKGLSLDEVRALFEQEVGIQRDAATVTDRQPIGGDSGYYVVGDEDSSEPEDDAEEEADQDHAVSDPELARPPNTPADQAGDAK